MYDEFSRNNIEENENSIIVSCEMPVDSWLVGYLLSFGDSVRVVSPSYLQNILYDEAKKICELNKKLT